MIETADLVDYLDDLLETSRIADYPGAINGLQLSNTGPIRKIAAAVDFSSRTVQAAIDENANLLLVHHGMFWGGPKPITGSHFRRLRLLIQNDVAVYSSHLPLDRHQTFGNNTLLSRALGLTPSAEFAEFKGSSIGLTGKANVPTVELFQRAESFAREHGGDAILGGSPVEITQSWAVCTGGGASADTLQEAHAKGIDTLIVGEGPHWTAIEAEELGVAVIYAGHYATETLGVRALAEHLATKFAIEWVPIHAPTGL
jgi:dinuclear metal center YbgI/SA1388 family protein